MCFYFLCPLLRVLFGELCPPQYGGGVVRELGAGNYVTPELRYTSRKPKMDTSKQKFVVLAVEEYKQLKDQYEVHLKNVMEEEKRRRSILISSMLRSTQRLKTGIEGETEATPTSESKMASQPTNVYLDTNMNMFMDAQRSTPFSGPLYQKEADPTTFYLNEDLTFQINVIEAEDLQTITEGCQESIDAGSSAFPSPVPMPANDGFSKDHTLFLINFMREHIESKGEGHPKTLKELNARLKTAKCSKKKLWRDAAEKLTGHFMQSFCPDKVARKWNTLAEAYKKIIENNKIPGKKKIRFQFYSEMDDLFTGQHDVVFPAVSTSHSPVPMPANVAFNTEQTLFLINRMREHIESKGEGLPKTLDELIARLKSPKGSKKAFWKDVADMLSTHFKESFSPDKVTRKWYTLVDAYKKIKDSNKTPEKHKIRFQFYSEMDDLLGKQHDVVFPVVGSGTSVGLDVRRPQAAPCQTTPPTSTPTPPCKRQKVDSELMQYLLDSEEASQRRHEETLAQLKSAQQGFEALMTKLLDKL
ncbi:uncharacterized protein [Misgurnus anguillicaudatus]|uniref:uncharacterized protein n=1 Tax=Misgurnus anguillicaudatus TaxID=75329 RepID=UPI002434A79D|nr:uncharacterized protein LOC129442543 [Misgurnus anguillicaudatus]